MYIDLFPCMAHVISKKSLMKIEVGTLKYMFYDFDIKLKIFDSLIWNWVQFQSYILYMIVEHTSSKMFLRVFGLGCLNLKLEFVDLEFQL